MLLSKGDHGAWKQASDLYNPFSGCPTRCKYTKLASWQAKPLPTWVPVSVLGFL